MAYYRLPGVLINVVEETIDDTGRSQECNMKLEGNPKRSRLAEEKPVSMSIEREY